MQLFHLFLSPIKADYKQHLKGAFRIANLKKEYKNENAIIVAVKELCSGVGKTSYGESKSNTIMSIEEIDNLFNDFENSNFIGTRVIARVIFLK